jgi:hypothetical protein
VTTSWDGRVASRILAGHASVVALLTAAFVLLSVAADAGAGLLGLPLVALGVPWSLPVLLDPSVFDGASAGLSLTVAFGPAWLNLALHAAALVWTARRHGRRLSRG